MKGKSPNSAGSTPAPKSAPAQRGGATGRATRRERRPAYPTPQGRSRNASERPRMGQNAPRLRREANTEPAGPAQAHATSANSRRAAPAAPPGPECPESPQRRAPGRIAAKKKRAPYHRRPLSNTPEPRAEKMRAAFTQLNCIQRPGILSVRHQERREAYHRPSGHASPAQNVAPHEPRSATE